MNALDIEIFSDLVCPWCYIGLRVRRHADMSFGKASRAAEKKIMKAKLQRSMCGGNFGHILDD
jgi:predicted DsbA family dithiol-disulfide isomerase